MEILVYREGAKTVESGFTVDQLPELLKEETSVIWVDMPEPTEADDRILLDVFHFHPLTVEDCRENRHYPKIEEFPSYLYFIVHGVTADTSPDRFNTIELDGFLGPNYVSLITMKRSAASLTSRNNWYQSAICQRGSAFLMHRFWIRSGYYSPVLMILTSESISWKKTSFSLKQPNNAILEDIMELSGSVAPAPDLPRRWTSSSHELRRSSLIQNDAALLSRHLRSPDPLQIWPKLSGPLSGALEAYLSRLKTA
jgi:magnesium transporter